MVARVVGGAADVSERRVAATHPADGPRPVHLVEGGEQRGQHRPVAGAGVGHHRPDHHVISCGQHRRVDDEGLLPEDMRIKGPPVGETERLGPSGQFDYATGRWVSLQDNPEIHDPNTMRASHAASGARPQLSPGPSPDGRLLPQPGCPRYATRPATKPAPTCSSGMKNQWPASHSIVPWPTGPCEDASDVISPIEAGTVQPVWGHTTLSLISTLSKRLSRSSRRASTRCTQGACLNRFCTVSAHLFVRNGALKHRPDHD